MARGKATAISTGNKPAVHMDKGAVGVMREIGIGIQKQKPKLLTFKTFEGADRLITMGCDIK